MRETKKTQETYDVIRNEGSYRAGRAPDWRQYWVVGDDAVTFVEMVAAPLGGWHVRGVETKPSGGDWPDMTRAQIVAWKERNHGSTRCDGNEALWVTQIALGRRAS